MLSKMAPAVSEVQLYFKWVGKEQRVRGARRAGPGEVNTSDCSGVHLLSSGTLQTKTATQTDVSGAATAPAISV